jgi:hypothetical protein
LYLGKGKKDYDKRNAIKERDLQRSHDWTIENFKKILRKLPICSWLWNKFDK